VMRIIVDADSMPVRIREIVCRSAGRRLVAVLFVANRAIPGLRGPGVTSEVVPDADEAIVAVATEADLVVTRDIPLAERMAHRGITVLNDRGDVFTHENVAERRSIRDAAQQIRDMGMERMGARRHGPREVQRFANALDRELTKRQVDTDPSNG
jgi:uncharacterized protein